MRQPSRALAWIVAGAVALVGLACTVTRRFLVPSDGGGDTAVVCAREIPRVRLSSQTPICVGDLAARTFRFALCSCVGLDLGAGFRTDSFDDSKGPYTPSAAAQAGGGPVGINGAVAIRAGAEVQGTLISAGTGPSSIGDSETIHGDLKTNGDLIVGNTVLVVRNAWVRGSISAPSGVIIAGNLVQPPGAALPAGLRLGGKSVVEDFTVAPPCACAPGDDIRNAIDDARSSNDNDLLALSTDALTDPAPSAQIHLPCGRFYVDAVSGSAPTTLVVEGHAALFVGGDFTAWDGLDVQFAPGGQLDVFVGGDFTLGTARSFGDPGRAAALRLYVAGTSVSMAGAAMFAGNLYAPVATVATQNIEIFGSMVASGLLSTRSTDAVAIHFDRAILDAGAACSVDSAPRSCQLCSDCQGADGCVDGFCTACRDDRDCCDPLVCIGGRCQALVF